MLQYFTNENNNWVIGKKIIPINENFIYSKNDYRSNIKRE